MTGRSSADGAITPYFESLAAGLIDPAQFAPIDQLLQAPGRLDALRALEADNSYPQESVDELIRLGAMRRFSPDNALCTFNQIAYLTASLTRYNTSLGVTIAVNGLALLPVYLAGNADQLALVSEWLKQGKLACLMLSELDAGSNLGLIHTRYRALDDAYVLNGSKDLINGAIRHPLSIILARSEQGQQFSLFMNPDGFGHSAQRRWHTTAARGANISGVDIEELSLPRKNLLGPEGAGLNIVRKTLSLSRGGVAFFAAGIAAAAVQRAHAYARQRRFSFPSGEKSLFDFDAITAHLGRQRAYELIAASVAWRSLLRVNDDGIGAAFYTAVSKYLCTTVAEKAVDEGTPVLSARALLQDEPYSQLVADVRLFPIFDGTTHVILDEIATTAFAYCDSATAPAPCAMARRGILEICKHKGQRRIVSARLQISSLSLIPALEAARLKTTAALVLDLLKLALDDPAWPAQQTLRHAAAKTICALEGIQSVLLLSLNANRAQLRIAPCEEPDHGTVALALSLLLRDLAGAAADMAALMLPAEERVGSTLAQIHLTSVALARACIHLSGVDVDAK